MSLPLLMPRAATGPSVTSRAPDGWRGFAQVAEAWGVTVQVEEPVQPSANESVSTDERESTDEPEPIDESWILAFPAHLSVLARSTDLAQHLERGGQVLVAYSGIELAPEEEAFFEELGITLQLRPLPRSLLPWRWWQQQRAGESHLLVEGDGIEAERVADGLFERVSRTPGALVESARLAALPESSSGCQVVAQRSGDPSSLAPRIEATALRCQRDGGVLWIVPSSSLSNARIGRDGNLLLAATLVRGLSPKWRVIEGSGLGVTPVNAESARAARRTLDVMSWQLGLLYLALLLALGRSFGPRWRPAGLPPEGHRAFLLGLGALHQRLGGFEQAARLLEERWFDYAPLARRRAMAPTDPSAASDFAQPEITSAHDAPSLVRVAQRLSRK